jgi:hypothetical protein
MPVKDTFHDLVKRALQKEGWNITHDPLFLGWGEVDLYVDLGAEQVVAAQKGEQKIAVEIKSFLASSIMSDFHTAVGQYIDYRTVLEESEPDRILYLAVPLEIYDSFFQRTFTRTVISRQQIRFFVYDIQQEVIILWEK